MNDFDAIKNYLNSWAQAAQKTSSDTAELCTRSLTKLIQSLEWELSTAKQEVEGLRRVIANSITKEAAVEQINAAYEPMVTELAAERKEGDTLRETVQTLRNLQEADRAEIEQLKNDLKLTRDEVNTANAEAQSWARNCRASDLEVTTLKQRLHNVEQDHAHINDHCVKLARDNEVTTRLYRKYRRMFKNSKLNAQARTAEIRSLYEQNNELMTQIQNLSAEWETARAGLEACTAVLEKNEQEMARLKGGLRMEALQTFTEQGREVLNVALDMTNEKVNALQFGGHGYLWKAITNFRRAARWQR